MTLSVSSTVEELVAAQLASGRFADANEVLLDALQKQRELQQEEEFDDDWPAVKEALDEVEAGDQGRPAKEVFEELRQKFNL
jgi:Arc/MetJ-type ribon-helix-helix transcriptional regulator